MFISIKINEKKTKPKTYWCKRRRRPHTLLFFCLVTLWRAVHIFRNWNSLTFSLEAAWRLTINSIINHLSRFSNTPVILSFHSWILLGLFSARSTSSRLSMLLCVRDWIPQLPSYSHTPTHTHTQVHAWAFAHLMSESHSVNGLVRCDDIYKIGDNGTLYSVQGMIPSCG